MIHMHVSVDRLRRTSTLSVSKKSEVELTYYGSHSLQFGIPAQALAHLPPFVMHGLGLLPCLLKVTV